MIIPSLLTTNERIAQERIALAEHMSGWLHVDWLDATLYPHTSLSLGQLEKLHFGHLSLEWHCMVNDPLPLVASSLAVDRMIIHYEIADREQIYDALIKKGINTWIAVDPSTHILGLRLPEDLAGVLLLGVVPGQSGQPMVDAMGERLELFRDRYPDLPLEVDGGVNNRNLRRLLSYGVDSIVMGSAIFNNPTPHEAYRALAELADPIAGLHADAKEARQAS